MPDAPAAAVAPAAPFQHEVAVQRPLTLIMKIKSPADYAQLKEILDGFHAAPPGENKIWRALETLNTVHFARFVFMEDNTKLAVITTYDNTFESYIADFTRVIGRVFDALLSHMEGAPPTPVQQHPKEFLEYVRSNDLSNELRGNPPLYSAYPKATVTDIKAALLEQA